MKKHVLFIQGGGQGAYEVDGKLVTDLQEQLGAAYHVHYPPMPNEDRPQYAAWKEQIRQELAALSGEVILVGHSLGASLLLKYLAEESVTTPLAGLFLLAAPYWGAPDWEVDEYSLSANFAAKLPQPLPVYFYHSRDDEWVPFAHLACYTAKLPRAVAREFDDRGHQFNDDLSEVADDIKSLKSL